MKQTNSVNFVSGKLKHLEKWVTNEGPRERGTRWEGRGRVVRWGVGWGVGGWLGKSLKLIHRWRTTPKDRQLQRVGGLRLWLVGGRSPAHRAGRGLRGSLCVCVCVWMLIWAGGYWNSWEIFTNLISGRGSFPFVSIGFLFKFNFMQMISLFCFNLNRFNRLWRVDLIKIENVEHIFVGFNFNDNNFLIQLNLNDLN